MHWSITVLSRVCWYWALQACMHVIGQGVLLDRLGEHATAI